jgi:small-conductance mechanosensitive channel
MDALYTLRDRLTDLYAHRDRLMDSPLTANLLAAAGLAVAALVAFWVVRRLLRGCCGRVGHWTGSHHLGAAAGEIARRAEWLLLRLSLGVVLLVAAGAVAYHFAGRDVRHDIRRWLDSLRREDLLGAGLWLAGLALPLAAAWLAAWLVRRARPRLEGLAAVRLGRPVNETDLRRWFGVLEGFAVAAGGIAAAWAATRLLALPPPAGWAVALAARLTMILAGVRLLPLGAAMLAASAAEFGDRHLIEGRLAHYWERLRRLFPFGLRCFAAVVYIYAASRAIREIEAVAFLADYAMRIVACIGIFFVCRVAIEVAQVLLHEAFGLFEQGEAADQKGQTLVPLLQSLCQYVLYCGSGVIMLGVLGVNTGPILAGAGLVGLAIGLGAQSLVTDVVSGFFILFENQYLVGDHVRIGEEAAGVVEAVSIRHTQVRDGQGRLHIIPNGQIKGVVNSSKGYINAVVDLRLPADAELEAVLDAMREAGRRLRREHPAGVLAETEVQGLADVGLSEMTVRAVTRVRPGSHEGMQAEYRRLLRGVLEERRLLGRTRQAA